MRYAVAIIALYFVYELGYLQGMHAIIDLYEASL